MIGTMRPLRLRLLPCADAAARAGGVGVVGALAHAMARGPSVPDSACREPGPWACALMRPAGLVGCEGTDGDRDEQADPGPAFVVVLPVQQLTPTAAALRRSEKGVVTSWSTQAVSTQAGSSRVGAPDGAPKDGTLITRADATGGSRSRRQRLRSRYGARGAAGRRCRAGGPGAERRGAGDFACSSYEQLVLTALVVRACGDWRRVVGRRCARRLGAELWYAHSCGRGMVGRRGGGDREAKRSGRCACRCNGAGRSRRGRGQAWRAEGRGCARRWSAIDRSTRPCSNGSCNSWSTRGLSTRGRAPQVGAVEWRGRSPGQTWAPELDARAGRQGWAPGLGVGALKA